MLRVAINGFGRIGRSIVRINHQKNLFNIVAINDLDPNIGNHAYLLEHDSLYGHLGEAVSVEESTNSILFGGNAISFFSESNITNVPWPTADIIIDASGVKGNAENATLLVQKKVTKKVIVTHSPAKGCDFSLLFGVNEKEYSQANHHVISTGTCDANAVGPTISAIEKKFGIVSGHLTTLHPWLSYQNVLDGSLRSVSSPTHFWSDFSLGRSSIGNLIPKGTTTIDVIEKSIPGISKKLQAFSYRVPTSIVSSADLTLQLARPTTKEEVISYFKTLSKEHPRIFASENKPLVSIDYLKREQSSIIDERWISLAGTELLKLVLWYDNEWGYAHRVVDAALLLGK